MAFDFTVDQVTSRPGVWLRHLSQYRDKEAHYLEVGSNEGRSAIWMLQNILIHPRSTVTCVDVWRRPAFERRFDANIVKTALSHKVIKVKGQSSLALRIGRRITSGFQYEAGRTT
jgi:predicted O-methyltransferase YrrM